MNDYTMTIERAGKGDPISRRLMYSPTSRIKWVSREKDSEGRPLYERAPSPTTISYPVLTGFFAAGKHYSNWKQLIRKDDYRPDNTDKFGRPVLYLDERYPCFDSSDYLHENRFYRWFYLRSGDRLTVVYVEDDSKLVHVTEDALDVECDFEKLRQSCLFRENV